MLFLSIGVILVVKMVPHTTSALCYLIRWIDPPELILTISTATPDASLRDLYAPWSLSRKFAIVVDLKSFIAFISSGSSVLSSALCVLLSSFIVALSSPEDQTRSPRPYILLGPSRSSRRARLKSSLPFPSDPSCYRHFVFSI